MSFFKDQDKAQGVLFGDDKVIIANFALEDGDTMYAGVLLGEPTQSMIVTPKDLAGKNSNEINTKVRLCFQDVESIDTLIDALKRSKRMIGDREIEKALKPGEN